MWKSLGGILVNIVPREVPRQKKTRGLRHLGFLALELPRDNIHQDTPSAFPNIVSMQCSVVKGNELSYVIIFAQIESKYFSADP